MLGGQEEEGDKVWFMGSIRPKKMEDTVEQGSGVRTYCRSQWKGFSFRSKTVSMEAGRKGLHNDRKHKLAGRKSATCHPL